MDKMACLIIGIRRALVWFGSLVALVIIQTASGQVVLETRDLRMVVREDGVLQSLSARNSGKEYAWLSKPGSIATVYRGGKAFYASHVDYKEDEAPLYRGGQSFPASGVQRTGNRLTVEFAGANVKATYQVRTNEHYVALKLLAVEGEPIDRIDLLHLRLRKLPHLGAWINVAYDDEFGICVCAGNIRTNAGMNRRDKYVELRAMAEKQVRLGQAVAVLFGCPDPKNKFLDAMAVVERDFKLPAGARRRGSPIQKYSYLWARPTPENIGEYIQIARRCGFRMILFSYTAFSRGAGHFLWNEHYPHGIADLKKVTDAIREAGLKLGLHIHYSKAHKSDPYVTPVPDDRLHTVRTFTLPLAIDRRTDTITVKENPKGCTLDEGRRILKAGKELITYQSYTTEPPYQFTGCERGHLDTAALARGAGERIGLLNVDDWNIFVRFNQNSDIQDEVGRRIGEIVNQTGPYDMVYFDGAEDVHSPYWYHVANAQYRVYQHFQHEPAVCETAMNTHFSWHMMSRSNAYDVPSKHIKNFTYHVPSRTAPVRAMDFTRIEFGWLFGLYDYVGPDVLEYVLSRAAAWDCPFSIRISPAQLMAHARGEDCLNVIKIWEDARIEDRLPHAYRGMLRTLDSKDHRLVRVWDAVMKQDWKDTWMNTEFSDQEHHLFLNERGEYELVAIDEIPDVANSFCKAYSFQRTTRPNDSYVLLWAVKGKADLLIPVGPGRITAMRPFGKELPVRAEGEAAVVPIGDRSYLYLVGVPIEQTRRSLQRAKLRRQGRSANSSK